MLSSPFDRPFTITLPPPPPEEPPSTDNQSRPPEIIERPNGATSIFIKRRDDQCLAQGHFGKELPPQLEGRITPEEYEYSITRVNESLDDLPTLWVGYAPGAVCSGLAAMFILVAVLGVGVKEEVMGPAIWAWGIFFVLTLLGFGFYFYMEKGLVKAIRECNGSGEGEVEGGGLRWRRGKGRRHGEIEIIFTDNCLEVDEEVGGEGKEVGGNAEEMEEIIVEGEGGVEKFISEEEIE